LECRDGIGHASEVGQPARVLWPHGMGSQARTLGHMIVDVVDELLVVLEVDVVRVEDDVLLVLVVLVLVGAGTVVEVVGVPLVTARPMSPWSSANVSARL
jgi:hypothetical protein